MPFAYILANYYTMNQYEVSAEIADEIPEIQTEIVRPPVFGSVYMSIKVLTIYTGKMLQDHQLRQVERCMKLADKIYNKGNKLVKSAVENVFIFSFSNLQCTCTRREWQEVQTKMPVTLFSLYIQQIMKPGI
jgi:hypothetical protein